MEKNLEFKWLLKQGIDSVANRQHRTVEAVERQIGEALSVSHYTIQRWKRGFAPEEPVRLEFLIKYCQTYGQVDGSWAQSLLIQGRHPDPNRVLDHLFPPESGHLDEREIPPVHHNLPPRWGHFIGRETEISRVLDWANSPGEPLASIEGMGGIGKTSLALEAGHRCLPDEHAAIGNPFYAVVWVSAREEANFDLQLNRVLNKIAEVLDYAYLAQLDPEKKTHSVGKLLRKYRTLIIVDNFEIIQDEALVKFLKWIPEPSKVLITTRYKQFDGVCIPLPGLKDEETLSLIRTHSQRLDLNLIARADDETLYRLAAATQNNPKAVTLSLGLIEKGHAFNTVVEELQQAGQVVEEIFEFLFAEVWQLLTSAARRILLTMPLFVSSADQAALLAVSELKEDAFYQAIEQLVTLSLLEASRAPNLKRQRYSIHPLTRAFIKGKLGVDRSLNLVSGQASRAEAHPAEVTRLKSKFWTFFADWCQKEAGRDYWGNVLWRTEVLAELYQEMPNLLLSLNWAYNSQAWAVVLILAKTIVHPIYYQGQIHERIRCSQYGIEAARKLGMVKDEIWFTMDGLGLVYHQLGDHEKTKATVLQGIQLARANNLPQAIALGEVLLSYEALRTCYLPEAQAHVAEALRIAESLEQGQDPYYFYFKYRVCCAAGHLARHLHRYEEAELYYLQAAEYLKETPYRHKIDLYLGFTNLGLNRYRKARDYFQRALEIHRSYGNQRIIARAKFGLASMYKAQAEKLIDRASELADEAHEMFSQMNLQRELEQTETLKERLSIF